MSTTPRGWADHPAYLDAGYKSTALRAPTHAPIALPGSLSTETGPVYGAGDVLDTDADLTRNARRNGEPIGERIIVTGQVLDELGAPVPETVIEIWQANACGRYIHDVDQHDAPIDPNFLGAGRCVSDTNGHYRYLSIKPGAYPWGNHPNAWRPAHIHLSLFGSNIATRLVTQMYFPGDPLLPLDPIYAATPAHSRERLIAEFDLSVTEPEFALGYRFDIVLRGTNATPAQG